MGGIARMCKLYGKMKIGDVMWVWDYARDIPVKEPDMTKEQREASKEAKKLLMEEQLKQETTKGKR